MTGNTSKTSPELQRSQAPEAGSEKSLKGASGQERALSCARAAIDKKAENVRILDLRGVSGFTDYFVIASAMSERQVHAVADSIMDELRKEGLKPVSVEGLDEARWVLLDFGDVVAHVFLDPVREYYALETLWASAPRVAVPSSYYGPAATRLG